ncbi:PREDICTED: cytosolic acyl coenzyme A thioester hydrolase [Condylura cristata]|uniref:cytosolic acyl coenzyme A thioester hydrolase n=1 Tax=Condylura cristata TaxID=143302 RepID=UPI000642C1DA|nr:PREDICTED: cytosolic acyl coenzyme A thioester hydrolase [Condylura cristata]
MPGPRAGRLRPHGASPELWPAGAPQVQGCGCHPCQHTRWEYPPPTPALPAPRGPQAHSPSLPAPLASGAPGDPSGWADCKDLLGRRGSAWWKLLFPPAGTSLASRTRSEPACLCRIMRPDDANVAGNVHGGTILKMIEEAGAIISTRHCNSQNGVSAAPSPACGAAGAWSGLPQDLGPSGDAGPVGGGLPCYMTAVAVTLRLGGRPLPCGLSGALQCRFRNGAGGVRGLTVSPQYSRREQEEEGRKRYEAQKLERMETRWRNGDVVQPALNPEPNTVSYSQSSLIHLVGPSDCTLHGFVHGGVTMKLMDEVAGIVAARHCKTNIVTASVDAINFHDKIRKGCVITISGRMTFTSNKSMEIEVLVDADPVVDNSQKRYRAASAFFTYVSLSQEGRSLPVPQLVPETEDEKKRFEEGKGRYLQMKAKRQGHAEPQP